jgi:hypothetical protein
MGYLISFIATILPSLIRGITGAAVGAGVYSLLNNTLIPYINQYIDQITNTLSDTSSLGVLALQLFTTLNVLGCVNLIISTGMACISFKIVSVSFKAYAGVKSA